MSNALQRPVVDVNMTLTWRLTCSNKFEIKITADQAPVIKELRTKLDALQETGSELQKELEQELGAGTKLCDVAVKRLAVTVYPSYANTPNFNPCAMDGFFSPSVLIGSGNSIAPLTVRLLPRDDNRIDSK